ncbi:hypothetical protein GCM10011366_12770 [Ornithinimicrobium tianjinense]|uniref:Uncharacterized protein n=1 Tax=Ornithinimicrobium tianjinense TaxID=1195761 RepID=A0A917F419_9MICO|nr:hypothetical protein GCM10011366_12770 [Ornithinimicrobium tianjinense]
MTEERQPASWWLHKAHARVTDWERRGGDYAVWARSDAKIVQEHRPVPFETGAPCQECGKAWPCGMFRAVLASD